MTAMVVWDAMRAMAGAWDSWIFLPLFGVSLWVGNQIGRQP